MESKNKEDQLLQFRSRGNGKFRGESTDFMSNLQFADTIDDPQNLASANNSFTLYKTHGSTKKAEFIRSQHQKDEVSSANIEQMIAELTRQLKEEAREKHLEYLQKMMCKRIMKGKRNLKANCQSTQCIETSRRHSMLRAANDIASQQIDVDTSEAPCLSESRNLPEIKT